VTARDRTIIAVVVIATAVAGFWFAVLAPKRKDAKALDGQIATAEQRLQAAEASAAAAEQAKRRYNGDYATIARLGKAVPADDNIASLVYQVQAAARRARIDFRSLGLTQSGTQASTTPSAAIGQAANATQSGGAGSASGSSGSSGSGGSGGSSASTSTPASASAAATQSATASLPPGATVGSAGFPTMPFKFVFNGSYFDMEHMLAEINRFVRVRGQGVDVRGRLLSIDGIALQAAPEGFPRVKASIAATAYLLSAEEGLTGGATPGGPASDAQPASTGTGRPTAPSATVVGRAP